MLKIIDELNLIDLLIYSKIMDVYRILEHNHLNILNPGIITIQTIGLTMWSSSAGHGKPPGLVILPIMLSELILILVWYFECLYDSIRVLVAYVCVLIFENWTGKKIFTGETVFVWGEYSPFIYFCWLV